MAPMIETLLGSQRPDYGVLACGWPPLDMDGYCPSVAYLASHGFCLESDLRPCLQYSASETDFNLEPVVPVAQRLSAQGTKAPILVRMDSGFDAVRLLREIEACNRPVLGQVDWLIKWKARSTGLAALAAQLDAEPATRWEQACAGKRVTTWQQPLQVRGIVRSLRRVLRLIERTIDKPGQALLVPELTLEGWTTSLPGTLDAQAIIGLYADHGTHEQFHSEFKTDLDLTRPPSGKFDTNCFVCQPAAMVMNIPRLMRQCGLLGPDAPVRHSAKRQRIKTVMQELIYRAGRLNLTGRRLILGLGAHDRAAKVFMRSFAQFAATA
jgi:hypothetical protein